jgi:hypothetical protein
MAAGLDDACALNRFVKNFGGLQSPELLDTIAASTNALMGCDECSLAFALEAVLKVPVSLEAVREVGAKLQQSSASSCQVVTLLLMLAAARWQHGLQLPLPVILAEADSHCQVAGPNTIPELEAMSAVLQLEEPVGAVLQQLQAYVDKQQKGMHPERKLQADLKASAKEMAATMEVRVVRQYITIFEVEAFTRLLGAWQQQLLMPGTSTAVRPRSLADFQHSIDAQLQPEMPLLDALSAIPVSALQAHQDMLHVILWHCLSLEPLGATHVVMLHPTTISQPQTIPDLSRKAHLIIFMHSRQSSGAVEEVSALVTTPASATYLCPKNAQRKCTQSAKSWLEAAGSNLSTLLSVNTYDLTGSPGGQASGGVEMVLCLQQLGAQAAIPDASLNLFNASADELRQLLESASAALYHHCSPAAGPAAYSNAKVAAHVVALLQDAIDSGSQVAADVGSCIEGIKAQAAAAFQSTSKALQQKNRALCSAPAASKVVTLAALLARKDTGRIGLGPAGQQLLQIMHPDRMMQDSRELLLAFQHVYGEAARALHCLNLHALKQAGNTSGKWGGASKAAECAGLVLELSQQSGHALGCFSFSHDRITLTNHATQREVFLRMDGLLRDALDSMEVSRQLQQANKLEGMFDTCWNVAMRPVMQLAHNAVRSHQVDVDAMDIDDAPGTTPAKSLRVQQWEQRIEAAAEAVSRLLANAKATQPPPQNIIVQLHKLAAQLESLNIGSLSDQQLKYMVYEHKKLQDDLELYQRDLRSRDPFLAVVPSSAAAMEAAYPEVTAACWKLDGQSDADPPSWAHLEDLKKRMQQLWSSCSASGAASWAAEAAVCLTSMQQLLAQSMKSQCWQQALDVLVLQQGGESAGPAAQQVQAAATAMLTVLSDNLGMALARERCKADGCDGAWQQLSNGFLEEVVLEFVKHRKELLLPEPSAGRPALAVADYAAIKQMSAGLLSGSGSNNLLTLQGHLRHLYSTVSAVQDQLRSYTLGAGCTLSPVMLSPVDMAAFFCPSSSAVATHLLQLSRPSSIQEPAATSVGQHSLHAQILGAVREHLLASFSYMSTPAGQLGSARVAVLSKEAEVLALCNTLAHFSEGAAAMWQDGGVRSCEGLHGPTGPSAQLGLAVQLLQLASHGYNAIDIPSILAFAQLSPTANVPGGSSSAITTLQQQRQQATKNLEVGKTAHNRLAGATAVSMLKSKKQKLSKLKRSLDVQAVAMSCNAGTAAGLRAEISDLKVEIDSMEDEMRSSQERLVSAEEAMVAIESALADAQKQHVGEVLRELQHVADTMMDMVGKVGPAILQGESGANASHPPAGQAGVSAGLLVMHVVERKLLHLPGACRDAVEELVHRLMQLAERLTRGCAQQLSATDALAAALHWVADVVHLAASAICNTLASLPDAATFLEDSRSVILLQDRQLDSLVEVISGEAPGLVRLVQEVAPAEAVLPVVRKLFSAISTLVPDLLALAAPWEDAQGSLMAAALHSLHLVAACAKVSLMYNTASVGSVHVAELAAYLAEASHLAASFGIQLPELPAQEAELQELLDDLATQTACILRSLSTLPQQACFEYISNPVALMQQAKARISDIGPALLPASYVAAKAVDVVAALVSSTGGSGGADGPWMPTGLRLADVKALQEVIYGLRDVVSCEVEASSVRSVLLAMTSSSSLDHLGRAAEHAKLQLTLNRGSSMKGHAAQLDSRVSLMLKELLKASVVAAESEFKAHLQTLAPRLSRFEDSTPLDILLEPPVDDDIWSARLNTAVVTLGDVHSTGRLAALLQQCDKHHAGRVLNQDQVALWLGQYHVVGQMLVHSILDAAELLLALYDFCPRLLQVSSLAQQYDAHVQEAITLLGTPLGNLGMEHSLAGAGPTASRSGGAAETAVGVLSALRDLEHWVFSQISSAMLKETQDLASSCSSDVGALGKLQEQLEKAQHAWTIASEALVEDMRSARIREMQEQAAYGRRKIEKYKEQKADYDRKVDEYKALARQADGRVDAALKACLQLAKHEELEQPGAQLQPSSGGLAEVLKHVEAIRSTLNGWVFGL